MAQSGFTPIVTYHTTTAAAVPLAANLAPGEMALNINDMKLYAENSAGVVTVLASAAGATGTVSSVAATVPAFLSVTGSPITTSGTLAIGLSGTALPIANGGTNATTAAAALVSLGNRTSATGAEIIPAGTTVQRDAVPVVGYLRYNSTTSEFEGYGGATPAWASVGGSAISNDTTTATNLYPAFLAATTGTAASIYTSNAKLLYKPSTGELQASGITALNGLVFNASTLVASTTVATGFNASSVGPFTIPSAMTVTVSTGSRWVVI